MLVSLESEAISLIVRLASPLSQDTPFTCGTRAHAQTHTPSAPGLRVSNKRISMPL